MGRGEGNFVIPRLSAIRCRLTEILSCFYSLSQGKKMVEPLKSKEPAMVQSGIGPSENLVCIFRGQIWEAVGPVLPISTLRQKLCSSHSCKLQQEGWDGRMATPCTTDVKAGLHATCSWWSANYSQWAPLESCRLLCRYWLHGGSQRRVKNEQEYPYILQQELLSHWGQALISAKGKHTREKRQHTGYHAKLSGQNVSCTTKEGAPLIPPECLPTTLYNATEGRE